MGLTNTGKAIIVVCFGLCIFLGMVIESFHIQYSYNREVMKENPYICDDIKKDPCSNQEDHIPQFNITSIFDTNSASLYKVVRNNENERIFEFNFDWKVVGDDTGVVELINKFVPNVSSYVIIRYRDISVDIVKKDNTNDYFFKINKSFGSVFEIYVYFEGFDYEIYSVNSETGIIEIIGTYDYLYFTLHSHNSNGTEWIFPCNSVQRRFYQKNIGYNFSAVKRMVVRIDEYCISMHFGIYKATLSNYWSDYQYICPYDIIQFPDK